MNVTSALVDAVANALQSRSAAAKRQAEQRAEQDERGAAARAREAEEAAAIARQQRTAPESELAAVESAQVACHARCTEIEAQIQHGPGRLFAERQRQALLLQKIIELREKLRVK